MSCYQPESDNIILPNGDVISGEFLTTIFDDFPDIIRAFQVKQKKDYSIELAFVEADNINSFNAIEIVRERLIKITSNQVIIKFEKISEIPHDRGKTKFVINEIISH